MAPAPSKPASHKAQVAHFQQSILPEDEHLVVNHTFKARSPYVDVETGFELGKNDQGVVTRVRSNRTDVIAKFYSRQGSKEHSVPLKCLDIGPKWGHWEVIHEKPKISQLSDVMPTPSMDTYPQHDIRHHLEALLCGYKENLSKIPNLDWHEKGLISTDEAIKTSANMYRTNLAAGAPNLLGQINQNRRLTIHDLIQLCPRIDFSNRKSGIYARVYSNFPRSSRFHGKVVLYIGQSVELGSRSKGHKDACFDKNDASYDGYHYRVARAAETWDILQLCVHHRAEGGGETAGKARRNLMEQMTINLFGSYASEVLSWHEDLADRKSVEQAILKSYDNRQLSQMFDQIATIAFAKSGWTAFIKRSDFGAQLGLNWTSPFGGEWHYEKLRWTCQDLGDRWGFHLPERSFKTNSDLATIGGRIAGSGEYATVGISRSSLDEKVNLKDGDKYYLTAEVMKPGKGVHPVPHVRLSDLGPYDNWSSANKVAFKIKYRRDSRWFVSYIQAAQANVPQNVDKSQPGTLFRYVKGVALYAYFMRAAWPHPPSFYRELGFAETFEIQFDNFLQEVRVSVTTKALVNLQRPICSETKMVDYMEDLGLRNVDGRFASRDMTYGYGTWSCEEHKCDRCLILEIMGPSPKCDRDGETRRCKSCKEAGLPCSWSPLPFLLGPDFANAKKNKTGTGRKFHELRKALICQPYSGFCTPQAVQELGLGVIASEPAVTTAAASKSPPPPSMSGLSVSGGASVTFPPSTYPHLTGSIATPPLESKASGSENTKEGNAWARGRLLGSGRSSKYENMQKPPEMPQASWDSLSDGYKKREIVRHEINRTAAGVTAKSACKRCREKRRPNCSFYRNYQRGKACGNCVVSGEKCEDYVREPHENV